eukprot:jgi/Bigna1/131970/aug1.16_g6678
MVNQNSLKVARSKPQAVLTRRSALVGIAAMAPSLMKSGSSKANGLTEYKRNSQSKLWIAGTELATLRLEKAKEYADGGLYVEARDALHEAAGSCVGEGGKPESRYRCLFNIFERSVGERAKEYVDGDDETKARVGLQSKEQLEEEIRELNEAFVTLQQAADGNREAMAKAPVQIEAAIAANARVKKSLIMAFGLKDAS